MTSGSNCWIFATRAVSIEASELKCCTPFSARTCSESLGNGLESRRRTADHCPMPSRRSRSDSGASAFSLGCIVQEMTRGSCGCWGVRWIVCMLRLSSRSGGLEMGIPISVSARLSSSVFGVVTDEEVILSSTLQEDNRADSSRQLPGFRRNHDGPMIRFCVRKRSSKEVCAPNIWVKDSPVIPSKGACPAESNTTFRKGNSPFAYFSAFSKA
mmetsp:Transcript_100745/g.291275  ORF Transcript_100745/g.291275 Transcript_100745/m.291275 type:complete len:213 (+) Transcript_100745:2662-3300(+)